MKVITDEFTISQYINNKTVADLIPEEVRRSGNVVMYNTAETIIREGEKSSSLFILVYGRCRLSTITPNGKRVIIRMVGPRSMIGEVELLSNEPSPFSITCLEECMFMTFDMEICRKVLLKDVHFLNWLCRMMMEKGQNSTHRLVQRLSYPLKNQFAKFILDNSEGDLFKVRKKIMSESLGVSYRHTSEMMNQLSLEGYLSKEKLVYRIINREKLQLLSRGMDY